MITVYELIFGVMNNFSYCGIFWKLKLEIRVS